jgi:hypothetical protein
MKFDAHNDLQVDQIWCCCQDEGEGVRQRRALTDANIRFTTTTHSELFAGCMKIKRCSIQTFSHAASADISNYVVQQGMGVVRTSEYWSPVRAYCGWPMSDVCLAFL